MTNGNHHPLEINYIVPYVVKMVNRMSLEEFKNWFIENCYFTNYRLKTALIEKFKTEDLEKMYQVMKTG